MLIKYTQYGDFSGFSNWRVMSRYKLEKAKEIVREQGRLIGEGCYRLNGCNVEVQEPTGVTFDKAWSLKINGKSLEKLAKKLNLPLEQK